MKGKTYNECDAMLSLLMLLNDRLKLKCDQTGELPACGMLSMSVIPSVSARRKERIESR